MEEFFPSEVARLVLGYLKESNCTKSYDIFIEESSHLAEYLSLYRSGKIYSTNVNGKSLLEFLMEYCILKSEDIRSENQIEHSDNCFDGENRNIVKKNDMKILVKGAVEDAFQQYLPILFKDKVDNINNVSTSTNEALCGNVQEFSASLAEHEEDIPDTTLNSTNKTTVTSSEQINEVSNNSECLKKAIKCEKDEDDIMQFFRSRSDDNNTHNTDTVVSADAFRYDLAPVSNSSHTNVDSGRILDAHPTTSTANDLSNIPENTASVVALSGEVNALTCTNNESSLTLSTNPFSNEYATVSNLALSSIPTYIVTNYPSDSNFMKTNAPYHIVINPSRSNTPFNSLTVPNLSRSNTPFNSLTVPNLSMNNSQNTEVPVIIPPSLNDVPNSTDTVLIGKGSEAVPVNEKGKAKHRNGEGKRGSSSAKKSRKEIYHDRKSNYSIDRASKKISDDSARSSKKKRSNSMEPYNLYQEDATASNKKLKFKTIFGDETAHRKKKSKSKICKRKLSEFFKTPTKEEKLSFSSESSSDSGSKPTSVIRLTKEN